MRSQYTRIPLATRHARKVDSSAGPAACWPWTGSKDGKGYGQIHTGGTEGRLMTASRVAWELAYGPIPEGMEICHSCDTPGCCNPRHLFLGTHAENVADMVAKGRQARGERGGQAKVTAEIVRQIRADYRSGVTNGAIAKAYSLSIAQVSRIVHRQQWAHID